MRSSRSLSSIYFIRISVFLTNFTICFSCEDFEEIKELFPFITEKLWNLIYQVFIWKHIYLFPVNCDIELILICSVMWIYDYPLHVIWCFLTKIFWKLNYFLFFLEYQIKHSNTNSSFKWEKKIRISFNVSSNKLRHFYKGTISDLHESTLTEYLIKLTAQYTNKKFFSEVQWILHIEYKI